MEETPVDRLQKACRGVANAYNRLRTPTMDGGHVTGALDYLEEAKGDLRAAVLGLSSLIDDQTHEIEKLRTALSEIAHDHAQHSLLIGPPLPEGVRTHGSRILGWAQGIAREALGEEQNEWTEHHKQIRKKTRDGL